MYQLYSFEILNNQHGLRLPKHQVGRNVSDLEICATIGDVIANIELHASTSAYVLAWHPSILLPAPFQEQVDQDDLRKGKPISRSLSNSEPRTGRYYLWTAALGATIFNLVHDAIPATHPTCIYIYIFFFARSAVSTDRQATKSNARRAGRDFQLLPCEASYASASGTVSTNRENNK